VSNKRNIYLVGPMGAGKTTVGRRLAEARRMEFVDSDLVVEARTGVNIAFIFEKEGEAGFRKREAAVIAELVQRDGIVLSTGGGAVMNAESRALLGAHGCVVYLHASVDHQLARTERTDNRPLLQVGDRRETLQRLFTLRDPLYREIADLIVNTDGRNARALAREIEDHYVRLVAAPVS
jgi:shikimate kinase